MKHSLFIFLMINVLLTSAYAQQRQIRGKIYDAQSKEPLPGATVMTANPAEGSAASATGSFRLSSDAKTVVISSVGYRRVTVEVPASGIINVALEPATEDLQTVIVTANREAQLRTEAPVAISKISSALINDTKATSLTELISKTPGVFMMRFTGEGHSMSIRQPLSTANYFLYMEDGVPVRPMGLFNHNGLIETNLMMINSIEVVKGPVSSIYGPEAVGGAINLITNRPTAVPTLKVGIQGDQYNFRRLQFGGGGMLSSKFGVYIGGYLSDQKNGWRERSDYVKNAVNVKAEYQLSGSTRLTGVYAYNDYKGQEGLSFDSTAFYSRSYETSQDFMYRNVKATRSRLTLDHSWNANAETFVTAFHRYNDYRFAPNHTVRWTTGAKTATSEKQRSIFNSYGLIAQHTQRFNFLNTKLLIGGTYDDTPTRYNAFSIDLAAETRADGRSVKKYTFLNDRPDVVLGDYEAQIHNTGLYSQLEFSPLKALRVTAGLRYDRMSFDYDNFLDKKSGTKSYEQVSPKVGMVYDLGRGRGLYANYGRGFAPPGLTAIFRLRPSVQQVAGQAPFYYNLQPARFENMEVGGWFSALQNKLYADVSIYRLNGTNELLSIRQTDNSTDYQSVGRTLHQGVEFGLTYKPSSEWLVRVGGANALHRFEDFQLSVRQADAVKNLSGKEMPSAPRWIVNTEVFYKPRWLKGFRVAAEWQRLTPFYLNQINTVRYDNQGAFGARGISVINTRLGYERKGVEVFVNVLNLTDELYISSASRGNNATDRTNFSPSAPRTVGLGVQYTFAGKAR
ncbi:TonB-dependent receptor [Spirosoma arcticum]